MMKNVCFKKSLVVGIILLFFGVCVNPTIGVSNNDDTTPPVTTYTLDPLEPDGLNDYYISNVTVTLEATDDISGVKEINYQINDGPIQIIPGDQGTFIIHTDSNLHTVKYWAIDNVGNIENQNQFQLKMDQTPPDIKGSFKIIGGSPWRGWHLVFSVESTDNCSGMERVEFKINDRLQDTVSGPGPLYEFGFCVYHTGVRVCGFIRNLEFTKDYLNFHAMIVRIVKPRSLEINISASTYDFAGHENTTYYNFPPPFPYESGIYLFQDLQLPSNYFGYVGRFLIFARFFHFLD